MFPRGVNSEMAWKMLRNLPAEIGGGWGGRWKAKQKKHISPGAMG